ncbi:MAG: dihydroorotate dehydrogenase [Eubacterium sp.]|nr:dihydroorotate dehydrogenase [Eubacterium sp.]
MSRLLKVNFAGIEFENPITTASGTFGSGMEYSEFVDIEELGAVTTKGVADKPWEGNPTPRVVETNAGMLNAIGLQNPGIDTFVKRDLPFLKEKGSRVIVNVCGHSEEEYLRVVERLAEKDVSSAVDMLEINISCPNVKQGGIAFGQKPDMAESITRAVKKIAAQPVVMKLSPNVTDITEMALAVEAGGADGVSLINTLTGMKIDVRKKAFALANQTGGMSGPAIHPIAVRMVYQVAHAVKIPIIGMGGVQSTDDALELMMAGATMVAVGTANFYHPTITAEIIDGLEAYANAEGLNSITEIIGCVG